MLVLKVLAGSETELVLKVLVGEETKKGVVGEVEERG